MGAWTEIVDYTVPSNTTSVVLNDFGSITKNDFFKIVANIKNNGASTANYELYPNTTVGVSGFDTATNYHRQALLGTGTSAVASRDNREAFHTVTNGLSSTMFGYIKISENNKYNLFTNRTDQDASSLLLVFDYSTSSGLTFSDPITSLTISTATANGIGTDSRIQIYRLDAEKVADITTTSNETQVDISSLSIGKDSEYLLVSDVISGGTNTLDFMVNDSTTLTDYHRQTIGGFGSSTFAQRTNDARGLEIISGNRSLSYAHIKLSEIGAYTAQSYTMFDVGLSSIQLYNYFISSTSEAITSITKINLKHRTTDGIATGSRFILYKLK
jgi:hypothetical protein